MDYFTKLNKDNKKWQLFKNDYLIIDGTEKIDDRLNIAEYHKVPSYILWAYQTEPHFLEKKFLEWEQGKR